jgi:rhomboid protease GluP
MSDSPTPAVNPLPPAVIVLFLIVVLSEIYIAGAEARLWGSIDARIGLIRQFSFMPEGFERAISAGLWIPELFWRMLTYPFVHGSLMQGVFASVFVLALGKFVGEVLGNVAVVAIFFSSAIFAALGSYYLLIQIFHFLAVSPQLTDLLVPLVLYFSAAQKGC